MLGKVLALSSLCSVVILSAVLQVTSPATMHPLGILFVFLLLYTSALGVLTFFVYVGVRMAVKVSNKYRRTHYKPISLKRAYAFGLVLAAAPVMLIAMQSIGRSSWYEVSLVLLFELVACFYVSKQS